MMSEKCRVTESQSNMKISLDVIANEYTYEKMNEICDALRWRLQRITAAPSEKVLTRVNINGNMVYIVGHGDCLAPNAEWRPVIELDEV